MLITEKEKLKRYGPEHRIWQGIPSIERTENGRMFCVFYSGNVKETWGNFVLLLESKDDGRTWKDPIAVIDCGEFARCYDSCLWIDPKGRLWWFWSVMPVNSVWYSVCDDPDSDILVWSEEKCLGGEVMMNRPTLLKNGNWLLPVAVWRDGVRSAGIPSTFGNEKKSFVYLSTDNGATFQRLGGAEVENRLFDEHMILEKKDGRLLMLVRTTYGIGKSLSEDGGESWSNGEDSGLPGPCSRFHIARLSSGNVLFISHLGEFCSNGNRSHLAAWISKNDGETWEGPLVLDERNSVSYPDAVERNGFIWIIYDRERGGFMSSPEEAMRSAREILFSKITEEDIEAGKIINAESSLKNTVSRLGYCVDDMHKYYN